MPMKPLSPVDCIRPAVERTEKLMFEPVRWSRWWRIAILGLATGEFANSGGCSFRGLGDMGKVSSPGSSSPSTVPHIPGTSPELIAMLIAILVVSVIVLVLVHLYVASVARFMLFDTVAAGRYHLREGWSRWHSHGIRYFLLNLTIGAIVLCGYLLLIGVPLLLVWRMGILHQIREHVGVFLFGLLVILPILLVFMLTLAIAMLFIKDFAVPIIALEKISIPEALRKLWGMVTSAKGDFAIYVLLKIAMAIVVSIALTIIDVIVLLIVLIPMAIIAAIVIAVIGAAAFKSPVAIALAITVAVVVVLPTILFVIGLVAAPVVVFYVSYALYFLGSRYETLWTYMHPEPEPSPQLEPTTPPPENPPLDMPPDPSPA